MFNLPDYVKTALSRLNGAGFEAYIVGGCVRDILLLKTPHDFDICTSAKPNETAALFCDDFKVIETGIKHGTVTVLISGEPVEITTFRIDGKYSDNRRPESVIFTPSLKEDLIRRDFTVNALSYSPEMGVIDYFDGSGDLKNKIIRCVGSPDERFREDALRILRAVRFSSVLGFEIEAETEKSIFRNKKLLDNISAERKASELNKLLLGKNAADALLKYSEIIAYIIPPLAACIGLDQKSPHHIYDVYTHTVKAIEVSENNLYIRLALLLHDIGKPSCMRVDENGRGHFKLHPDVGATLAKEVLNSLKYDNYTIKLVTTLIKYHDRTLYLTERAARRTLCKFTEPTLRALLSVMRADRAAHSKKDIARRINEVNSFEKIVDNVIEKRLCYSLSTLEINGEDLISIGIEKGAEIGSILKTLLDEVIENKLENNRAALTERARELKR